jgi:hypothetical protein
MARCLLLTLSGQSSSARFCPLLDQSGQRLISARDGLSANDPKRKSRLMAHGGTEVLSLLVKSVERPARPIAVRWIDSTSTVR